MPFLFGVMTSTLISSTKPKNQFLVLKNKQAFLKSTNNMESNLIIASNKLSPNFLKNRQISSSDKKYINNFATQKLIDDLLQKMQKNLKFKTMTMNELKSWLDFANIKLIEINPNEQKIFASKILYREFNFSLPIKYATQTISATVLIYNDALNELSFRNKVLHNQIITSNVRAFLEKFSNKIRQTSKNGLNFLDQLIKDNFTKIVDNKNNQIKDSFEGRIFEDSRQTLWAIGSGTPLQKSLDGGENWTILDSKNGSAIKNGISGAIFEDSRHILWAMGSGTPLQKSIDGGANWIVLNHKNGNLITDGANGMLFEDSRHILWALGNGTPLQKSTDGVNWTVLDSQSGSVITNGADGMLFEDSRHILWAFGNGTPLQKSTDGVNWTVLDSQSGSLITNGADAKIFEDSQQTLWAMGFSTPLQKSTDGVNWTVLDSQSGSLITNGYEGNIFEDSRHILWAMGNGTPLQKSMNGGIDWTVLDSQSGSVITDGADGMIIEDSQQTLWAIGNGTPLQKSSDGGMNWTVLDSQSRNTIADGYGGMLMEDSRHTLWAMGNKSPLQVITNTNIVNNKALWKSSKNFFGSAITDGTNGTIFEDSQQTLWAMGNGTPLQKSMNGGIDWTVLDSQSGSVITDGANGTIFEDSQQTLWAMGNGTPLQKSMNGGIDWTVLDSQSGSVITDGANGTIFEDSQQTLWAMGNGTPLQKLLFGTNKWISLSGSNAAQSKITDGAGGTIIEDSQQTLWAMGNGTRLQKSMNGGADWVTLSNKSRNLITDGFGGTIIEDSHQILWAMGNGTPLQKSTDGGINWITFNAKSGNRIENGAMGTIVEDSSGMVWAMAINSKLQVTNAYSLLSSKEMLSKKYNNLPLQVQTFIEKSFYQYIKLLKQTEHDFLLKKQLWLNSFLKLKYHTSTSYVAIYLKLKEDLIYNFHLLKNENLSLEAFYRRIINNQNFQTNSKIAKIIFHNFGQEIKLDLKYNDLFMATSLTNTHNNTITWKNADGTIKTQVTADIGANDMQTKGTDLITGTGVSALFAKRFYFTQIEYDNGEVIYNGVKQDLSTIAKIHSSAFYKSNPSAFKTKVNYDDEVIVMIDKLTGQLYVLHAEWFIKSGTMKVQYDATSQTYTWHLGASNGKFTIKKSPNIQDFLGIDVKVL